MESFTFLGSTLKRGSHTRTKPLPSSYCMKAFLTWTTLPCCALVHRHDSVKGRNRET